MIINLSVERLSGYLSGLASPGWDPKRGLTHVFWWLLAVCAVVYYCTSFVYLDDAYIYFRIARNFLDGLGPVFNQGDNFTLATSPLWLMLLSFFSFLTGWQMPVMAKFLFVLCLIGGSVSLRWLLKDRLPLISVLAPIPFFCTPSIVSLAGHDTALALLCGTLILAAFFKRNVFLLALMVGVGYLARGELGLIAGVYFLMSAYGEWSGGRSLVQFIKKSIFGISLAAALICLWHAVHYHYFGVVMPATLSAKILQGSNGWPLFYSALSNHVVWLGGAFKYVYWMLFLLGCAILAIGCRAIVVWPIVHFVLYSVLGVAWYHWYYYPVEWFAILAVCAGGSAIAVFLLRCLSFGTRHTTPIAAGVGVFVVLISAQSVSRLLLDGVGKISVSLLRGEGLSVGVADPRFKLYEAYSDWLLKQRSSGRLLSYEVGVFGYLLPKWEIRDVVGLATPVKSPKELWNWAAHVEALTPDYVIANVTEPGGFVLIDADKKAIVSLDQELVDVQRKFNLPAYLHKVSRFNGEDDLGSLEYVWRNSVELAHPVQIVKEDGSWVAFAHAPSVLSYSIPAGSKGLSIGYGILRGAVGPGKNTDGAKFSVSVVAGGRSRVIAEDSIFPSKNPAQIGVNFFKVDLSRIEDGGRLELKIETNGDPSWDWTYWGPFRVSH